MLSCQTEGNAFAGSLPPIADENIQNGRARSLLKSIYTSRAVVSNWTRSSRRFQPQANLPTDGCQTVSGAQDLYPALGWRYFWVGAHVAHSFAEERARFLGPRPYVVPRICIPPFCRCTRTCSRYVSSFRTGRDARAMSKVKLIFRRALPCHNGRSFCAASLPPVTDENIQSGRNAFAFSLHKHMFTTCLVQLSTHRHSRPSQDMRASQDAICTTNKVSRPVREGRLD